MCMSRSCLVVLASLIFTNLIGAAEPAAGKYKLFVARGTDVDLAVCVLSLEKKDGGWAASLVGRNTALGKVTVGAAKIVDGFLRIDMNISDEEVIFEGLANGDTKEVVGSCGNDRRLAIAHLTATDEDTIVREKMKSPRDLPPPLREYAKMEAERAELRKLADKATIVADRERLVGDLDRLQKKMDDELPKLVTDVLTNHADHPAAAEAGVNVLYHSYQSDAPADQLKKWTDATMTAAGRLGPRYRRDVLLLAVEYLGRNTKAPALAAEIATQAEKELGTGMTPIMQARILTILVTGLKNSDQNEAAKPHEERLAKLEAKLDEEYRAKLPKFTVKPFGKRKEKANCVAILEMFIGAEGQSGQAAGVAFDKLLEAYKPSEAVILQYHLHAPAPDALANADAEKRFEYYSKRYRYDADVIPVAFVNGRPKSPGGGRWSEGRNKFTDYCDAINPLVNDITPVKLSVKVKKTDDKIEMEFKYDDLPRDAKEIKMRLRAAIIEDSIRYPGGNGLRFHRNVVRAMPFGPDGKAIVDVADTIKESISIADIRKQLNKHLDKIANNDTPFPTPYRPIDLQKLKVAAWIQSDSDSAVWQAVMVDVGE